jgi:serpin B
MKTITIRVLGLITVAAFLCSCEPTSPGSDKESGTSGPTAPAADKTAAARDNNAFAVDLYGKLRTGDGNLFFSPESISTALAMTYAGARTQTAEQMAKTLHFTLPQERLHPALGALMADLNSGGKKRGYQLSVANALWGQKGHDFLPAFLTLLKDDYGAEMHEVDFLRDTEGARQTINSWVEKQTQDKIKDLIARDVLPPETQLVLTNAIYFKGDWNTQFKKDATRDAPFQVSAREKVNVPLMNQTGDFPYFEGESFQALEMPYVGKDLSMVVLLPKKADGLADLEKTLSTDKLADWLAKLHTDEVVVALPKFKLTSQFSLKDTLSAMGMVDAFTDSADFSGIDGNKNLFISAVIHKAFVDVNEEGTEAAAATAVIAQPTAARINPVFRADHPFLFLIRDKRSGSILFLGRVVNPKA